MMSFCQHMTCPPLIGESVYDNQLEVQNFSLHAHAWSKVNQFVSQSVWIWGMRNRKFICYGLMPLITYDRCACGVFHECTHSGWHTLSCCPTQADFESVLNDIGRPEFVDQLMMALHQVSIFRTSLGISKKCKRQRCSILPPKCWSPTGWRDKANTLLAKQLVRFNPGTFGP